MGTPFATVAAEKTTQNLEQYFKSWALAHRGVCEARVRKELSEPLMEKAMACLEGRLREADALTTLLRRADRDVAGPAGRLDLDDLPLLYR